MKRILTLYFSMLIYNFCYSQDSNYYVPIYVEFIESKNPYVVQLDSIYTIIFSTGFNRDKLCLISDREEWELELTTDERIGLAHSLDIHYNELESGFLLFRYNGRTYSVQLNRNFPILEIGMRYGYFYCYMNNSIFEIE
ncbi:MAG: hypothetical protein ACPGSD_02390 [Flavobacteriales bacterium]